MTRLVSATVILVLVAAVGYLAESASASVTGRLTGQVSVQGQSDLATVKTRLFALPSTLKQPIELANVVPYLFDLDRAGRFERELPAGTYLVGFTNPKLEFESSDATVKLIRNADILSLPVKSIAVRENASANLDLKITAASAALPDPDPRALTEPLGGGAPLSEARPNSSSTSWLIIGGLLLAIGVAAVLAGFLGAKARSSAPS